MQQYVLNLSNDGRILCTSYFEDISIFAENTVIVDALPDGNAYHYRYDGVTGEYIYDPLPEPELPVPHDESAVWDEMDAAYQEGVDSI